MPPGATAGTARWRKPISRLSARASARFAAAIAKRQGADRLPATLERRRLYILPSRGGVAFGILVLVMLVAGLNYVNSLALLLTFLLTAFALVVMQQCHRNLQGVTVQAAHAPAVFARGAGCVNLALANHTALARFGLLARIVKGGERRTGAAPGAQVLLGLPVAAPVRGLQRIERLRIATSHPFGLFTAWTWVHTSIEMLVYPYPEGSLPLPAQAAPVPGLRAREAAGVDEWAGVRPFRDGDSPRQVDWKAYAREAPLLVKEYRAAGTELRELDFAAVPLSGTEARLSQLTRWVLDAEARGESYALVLPGARLPMDHGPEHRHRCLAALALFGTPGPATGAVADG